MRVLSVGAGSEQVSAILKAKEKGYYIIAIDGNKDADGLKLADEGHVIDIKLKDKVLNFLADKNIQGIIQSPIGRYLTTIGAINDRFNLKGISEKAATICTDKVKTNEVLRKNNINCAKQILTKGKENILKAIKEIGFPCILKPRFGSGSKGVVVVEEEECANDLIDNHLKDIGDDSTIIESILLGQEYGLDAIVVDKKCKVILVRKKYMTEGLYRQEIGYIMPAKISKEIRLKINEVMQKVSNSIGLNNCLVQADILVDNDEINIIEVSGRPSGLNMSSKMVPLTTEIDFLGLGIDLSVNKLDMKKVLFKDSIEYLYAMYFLDIENCVVKNIPDLQEIKAIKNIIEYKSNIKLGDNLKNIKNGTDILNRGYIITKTKTEKEAIRILKEVKKKFN